MEKSRRITIIGAGLSGLTAAYLLREKGWEVRIIEASARIGGRIQTQTGQRGTPLELGATWLSDQHPALIALLEELGLRYFPQFSEGISFFQTKSFEPPQQFYVPAAEMPSYRVTGGTQALIDALVAKTGRDVITLNAPVTAITATAEGLAVNTSNGLSIPSDAVITCIPPALIASGITITPALPESICHILPAVQTWMAGAIKFTLEYSRPFWRMQQRSGMLYSHAGIITEMYDHTNAAGDKYGFTGFLSPGAAGYSSEVRRDYVLQQLEGLFGAEVREAVSYYDKVWTDEYISSGARVIHRPHQHHGHPVFASSYLGGRLFISGTETSPVCGGYMEGAVVAAQRGVSALLDTLIV